jgi:hypothetical protein
MAITISAMVAGAIAGMLGAVSTGVGTRKDHREIMVLAHSAQCRLSAYLATSRCVLSGTRDSITLWLNDDRESGTVHATEIRWLRFDSNTGEMIVEYVAFPASWTPTACELADAEYAAGADWAAVRSTYLSRGHLADQVLIDHLQDVEVMHDQATAALSKHIAFSLSFEGQNATVSVPVSGTIQLREPPVK